MSDLRRLLDSEGLTDARLQLTSARTGVGLDELRKVLTETVSARRAASERIGADVDAMIERFLPYMRASQQSDLADPSGDAEEVRDVPRAVPNCWPSRSPARREYQVSARPCRARGNSRRWTTWAGRWRGWPTG